MTRSEIKPPLTPATFHILLSLAAGPRHAYAVKRETEERTRDMVRLGAGTLYAAVKRLVEQGLIAEAPTPPATRTEAGTRWRFYRLTALGRQILEHELERLEADVRAGRRLLLRPEAQ